MKKKLLIVFGAIMVFLVIAFISITDGLKEGTAIPISGINLASVSDGDYTGTYDFKRWLNTVVVHIKGNRITGIELIEDVRAAGITSCSTEIFNRVIDAQSTDVDVVSGVTVTSKAYLKAIENALNK